MKLEQAWQVLGLAADPTPDALKDRWRVLRSEAHPDRPGGSTERFDLAQKAYRLAQAHADRDVDCTACRGTGKRSKQRGFGYMGFPCEKCNATGKVKRYA